MNKFLEGHGAKFKSSVQRKPLNDRADALAARAAIEVDALIEASVKSAEKQSLQATITSAKCTRLALVVDPFENGKCYKAKRNILKSIRPSAVWAPYLGAKM